MKKILLVALSCISLGLFAQNIQLNDITSEKYNSSKAPELVSSADGEHYFQPNEAKTMIIKYAYKTGLPVDTIFNTRKARESTIDTFEGFIIAPDEKSVIVFNESENIYRHSFKAQYYYYDIRRNHIRKLTENKGKQMTPVYSKDGRMLAYVLDNDIWLAKFDFDTESQITKDGQAGKLINGATDWVYEEEFGKTQLIEFSPDNTLLAFVTFDESEVPEFSFQTYENKLYPDLVSFKYPKAGEKNSKVICNVFDIQAKTTRKMNIPENDLEYISRIEFPANDYLAVMTLNRNQNEFNMYGVNPRSAVARQILNEKNDKYIDRGLAESIQFLGDQFVYLSEKGGYNHIYLYSNTGVQQKQLTSGDYDVTKILGVDRDKKAVYYQSAEESPMRRTISKVDLLKGNKTKLSDKAGFNTAELGDNAKYYINTWSDALTPALITVNDANGKVVRVIDDNAALKSRIQTLNLAKKEFIKVKSADGQDLNAWILKPANFNANQQYPLIMVQYSGPNSQQVLDKFSIDWVDYAVTQGFVVACVDGRGTGARGEEFRKTTYMNLGSKESDDQIAAAKYFGTLPYIDQSRIGIWGWSYGGYNVLMSMSRGNVFKAGVAIAAVTDWRFYDSVYTEAYMRTPQQNEFGYNTSSAIKLADKLHGNLLLVHASADDNVHMQNTMAYADALIKANKQFDLFIFPDLNHSILGASNRAYLYQKVINYFKLNL